jgi:hypothetical protein
MKNRNYLQLFDHLSSSVLVICNLFIILLLGFFDYSMGIEYSFSIFYLLPIAFTSWYVGKRSGIFTAIISSIFWFLADIIGGHLHSSTIILIWNSVIRFSLFVSIGMLISSFKSETKKLYQKELSLQKNRTIIETFQRLTLMIVDNITIQNAEIIKWVNEKKHKKKIVPEVLEQSSRLIGESLQILSEVSFVSPYITDAVVDADMYLEVLTKRLLKIKNEHSSVNNENDAGIKSLSDS